MQVKSKKEHSAILSTFIMLPVVIKTFVLSILGQVSSANVSGKSAEKKLMNIINEKYS